MGGKGIRHQDHPESPGEGAMGMALDDAYKGIFLTRKDWNSRM